MRQRTMLYTPVLFAVVMIASTHNVSGAEISAVQTSNGSPAKWAGGFATLNTSATVGWSFQIQGSDLNVDALGIFANAGSALADSHQIGLWTSAGVLVAEATIPSDTASTLVGDYRFVSITPVTLTAGDDYVIGAFYPAKASVDTPQEYVIANSGQTYSGVTFLNSLQSPLGPSGSFEFPTVNSGVNQGTFGPNFEFSEADATVPEPATAVLLGSALLLAVAYIKLRVQRRVS